MLAQHLRVSCPRLVRNVAITPIMQPALNEGGNRFGRGINVQAGDEAGDDLGGLGLRLRLGAVQGDVAGLALAVAGHVVLEAPTFAALAAPDEMALHFCSPSCAIAVPNAPSLTTGG